MGVADWLSIQQHGHRGSARGSRFHDLNGSTIRVTDGARGAGSSHSIASSDPGRSRTAPSLLGTREPGVGPGDELRSAPRRSARCRCRERAGLRRSSRCIRQADSLANLPFVKRPVLLQIADARRKPHRAVRAGPALASPKATCSSRRLPASSCSRTRSAPVATRRHA